MNYFHSKTWSSKTTCDFLAWAPHHSIDNCYFTETLQADASQVQHVDH